MRPGQVSNFECPQTLNQEANPEMENMFGNAYVAGFETSPTKYEIEIMHCAVEPPTQKE